MSVMDSLCLTCLADCVNGVLINPALGVFLENILCFKFPPRDDLSRHVCLGCYKSLCEMKRFYVQLQDVAHYFNQMVVQGSNREENKIEKDSNLLIGLKLCDKSLIKEEDYKKKVNSPELEIVDEDLVEKDDQSLNEADTSTDLSIEIIQDAPFKCTQCFRIYETHACYEKHMRWHIAHNTSGRRRPKEKKFICTTCEKRFRTLSELRSHEVTHTDLRPFQCEVCAKTFRQLSGLSVHRSVHYGKRLECPECGKRFSTKYELFRHMNVHKKKKKRYPCNRCSKAFPQYDELQKHKLAHGKIEQFKCNTCGKMYCNEESLDAHGNFAHHLENKKEKCLRSDEAKKVIGRCPSGRLIHGDDDDGLNLEEELITTAE